MIGRISTSIFTAQLFRCCYLYAFALNIKHCNLRYKQISHFRVSLIGSCRKVFCFAMFLQSMIFTLQGLSSSLALFKRAYLRYALLLRRIAYILIKQCTILDKLYKKTCFMLLLEH